jgi:hypothetical protein
MGVINNNAQLKVANRWYSAWVGGPVHRPGCADGVGLPGRRVDVVDNKLEMARPSGRHTINSNGPASKAVRDIVSAGADVSSDDEPRE